MADKPWQFQKGQVPWNFKTGFSIQPNGYMLNNKTKEYAHREVMVKKLGRKLKRGEIVHHLDGNKLNNDPANLKVISRESHIKEHGERLLNKKGGRFYNRWNGQFEGRQIPLWIM